MMIAGYKKDSLVDGEGIRFTIFMTGCIHRCPQCHNEQMQDYYAGYEVTNEEIFAEIRNTMPFISGITLSGGDPLFQLNNTKDFLGEFKKQKDFKELNVWLYTGYDFEQIPKGIRMYCDVIVDGRFNKELPRAKYRGSSNQNIYVRYPGSNKFIKRVYDE